MGKIPSTRLQEILFGSAEKAGSKRISSLEKEGLIRKIAPRIYTSNLSEKPATIIKRNWYHILSNQYPDAILSHRSGLEFKPTPAGHIYLTYSYTGKVLLPGLSIFFLKGPGRIDGDKPLFENLYVSQEARAYLENMQQTRKQGKESKTLSQEQIEEKLDSFIRVKGEGAFNTMRDKAREIAPLLRMEKEFTKLNKLMSDILGTGISRKLKSVAAQSRVLGDPLDPGRVELFETLYHELADGTFPDYADKNNTARSYQNFAFFESYFSNSELLTCSFNPS